MAAPGEKSATALEKERLLALIDRLEQELDAIDADAKAREERLAEIAEAQTDLADLAPKPVLDLSDLLAKRQARMGK